MESTSPHLPVDGKPLTDPADLFQLLGRMLASTVLFCLTVFWILHTSIDHDPKNLARNYTLTVTTAIISLMVQRATIKLWRRLRDERAEAEALREEQRKSNAE